MISVVVPTRNEAANIETLLTRLAHAMGDRPFEVIFVDDSTDTTPQTVQQAAVLFDFRIGLIARPPERRESGLGGAVVEGFHWAQSPWLCVMDADLQHPPTMVPKLLSKAESDDVDVVLGSRLIEGGDTHGLGQWRTIVSRVLALTTRLTFPMRLRRISDPLTGLFLIRNGAVDLEKLQPDGFKILLEILVRCPKLNVAEVPFSFDHRHAGESKAGFDEVIRLIRHYVRLRISADTYLIRFLLVGLTGLLVNTASVYLLTERSGFYYLVSVAIAKAISTFWNFSLCEIWVFDDRRTRSILFRFSGFLIMNTLMLLLLAPMISVLVETAGIYYVFATLIATVGMTSARFYIADQILWSRKPGQGLNPGEVPVEHFFYNIHDVVTVRSEAPLPELAHFEAAELIEAPDIVVRIVLHSTQSRLGPHAITYNEAWGLKGFWMSVGLGEVNRIDVSPFVARSPHVLYTNVVEPVLRWVLVRRGYALTHAACLSLAGKGLFITAKADTGKTTTMLKSLLARPDATFLADDMVIVGVDGTVLSYPKPLTISKQTLQAVGSRHTLTLRERMILPVQSLLHSKHGRWLGKFFAQLALPTATLNAIVQRIVPPPKFRVERIVPNVKYGNRARLSQIVLIERGNQMEESISAEKLPAILVENAEDAFRFPPYGEVEQQLCKWQGADLHSAEYEIIQSATKQCNGVRIVDPNFGWWRKVPQLMAVHSPSVNDLKVAEA